MRAFLGLPFDHRTAASIADWRDRHLPPFARPVPVQNLHITLAFLGEISPSQLQDIDARLASVSAPAFELKLDAMEYWPKPEISCLAATEVPPSLSGLVAELRQCMRRIGLRVERREYQPHVTLARRCAQAPPAALVPPDIDCRFGEFALFESLLQSGGARYEIVRAWAMDASVQVSS